MINSKTYKKTNTNASLTKQDCKLVQHAFARVQHFKTFKHGCCSNQQVECSETHIAQINPPQQKWHPH